MKKKTLLLTFVVLITGFVSAQVQNNKNSGSGFAYQAVLRDINGNVLDKKEVKLTFSLFASEAELPAQWSQTKTLATDQFGVVKTIVGKGDNNKTPADGFVEVNFSMAQYWFKVELQLGEEEKREISFAQLPSMPYAESAFSVSFTMPVGSIVSYAGTGDNVPEGWALCNGAQLLIEEYPALFETIGYNWKKRYGNGVVEEPNQGYFHVPDLRGVFLRGLDTREFVGYDPDYQRALGSHQEAATNIKNFNGSFKTLNTKDLSEIPIGVFDNTTTEVYGQNILNDVNTIGGGGKEFDETRIQTVKLSVPSEYQTETRPVNVAVHYIIKL